MVTCVLTVKCLQQTGVQVILEAESNGVVGIEKKWKHNYIRYESTQNETQVLGK